MKVEDASLVISVEGLRLTAALAPGVSSFAWAGTNARGVTSVSMLPLETAPVRMASSSARKVERASQMNSVAAANSTAAPVPAALSSALRRTAVCLTSNAERFPQRPPPVRWALSGVTAVVCRGTSARRQGRPREVPLTGS